MNYCLQLILSSVSKEFRRTPRCDYRPYQTISRIFKSNFWRFFSIYPDCVSAPYPSLNGDCFGYEVFPFPFHIVPFGPSFKHLHVKGKMGIFWSSTFSSSTEPKCTRFAALLYVLTYLDLILSHFSVFRNALPLWKIVCIRLKTDICTTLFNFSLE